MVRVVLLVVWMTKLKAHRLRFIETHVFVELHNGRGYYLEFSLVRPRCFCQSNHQHHKGPRKHERNGTRNRVSFEFFLLHGLRTDCNGCPIELQRENSNGRKLVLAQARRRQSWWFYSSFSIVICDYFNLNLIECCLFRSRSWQVARNRERTSSWVDKFPFFSLTWTPDTEINSVILVRAFL